jgi:RNA polymerase sigma-70 factor (ECF subfamily)
MLRSRSDAEDLLQDVYLRRHDSYSTSIQSAVAFLITITTRLCLDRIQERKRERAGEVERSLSVLSVDEHIPSPETQRELSEEVSVAILAVLDRLGPEERTAFLLREVFDYDYSESAQILGKAEAACRQMIRRARAQVRESSPRFRVTAESRERMLGRFRVAASSGDRQAVMALLTEEVEYVAEPASGGTKNAEVRRSSYVIGRTARPSCGHLVSQTIARERSRPPGASALVLDEEHDELRQRMWGPSDTAHPGAGVSTPAWCGA